MDSLPLLRTAASGMEAQRDALDVAARNIAAAEAAGPKGSFDAQIAKFELNDDENGVPEISFAGTQTERGTPVDVMREMIDVLNATRAYEANASVFEIGKQLAQRTIDMGRL